MSKVVPILSPEGVARMVQQSVYQLVDLEVLNDDFPDRVATCGKTRGELQAALYTFKAISKLLENSL